VQQNKVGEPKLFKLFGHFSLVLLLGASTLSAESFADFKRSQATSFKKYKDERDNEFKKYLAEQWKAYNVFKGTPLYEKPKPKRIAPARPKKIQVAGPKISIQVKPVQHVEPKPVQEHVQERVAPKKIQEIIVLPKPVHIAPKPQKKPEVKVVTTPKPTVIAKPIVIPLPKVEKPTQRVVKKDINFDFYGTKLGFYIPDGIKHAKYYPQTQKGITNFFDSAATSDYKVLINEVARIQHVMNLNDWATYLLVTKISKSVFSNQDDSRLLSWFIFNKLGYAVKVGLAKKHIVLMHYSKKVIYSTPNYNFGNKKYYVVANYNKGSVGRLYSYKQNYPGSTKAMDLNMRTLPKFSSNMKSKKLSFRENGRKYKIGFEYNQNLIDFMATYPQADYETFFNAPLDERTYQDIAKDLKKYIDGKRASEAMNFVLHFVQKSFKYERDDAQFGREKVMFAQETLYFDKSDCEDRAILYSYLMKELFGVAVVGVKYSDHMATALYVPMSGDTVRKGNVKFVVADPTYINASIGQSMPQYRSVQPESFVLVQKNN